VSGDSSELVLMPASRYRLRHVTPLGIFRLYSRKDRAAALAPTEFGLFEIDRHRAEIEAALAPRTQAAE